MKSLLKFTYENWRGVEYEYVIEPDSTFTFNTKLQSPWEDGRTAAWTVSGYLVTRDGDVRPEMGPSRRRSFELVKMRNIEEVERSE